MKIALEKIADITMGQSPKSDYYNNHGEGLPFLQGNRTFGDLYPSFDTYTTAPIKIAEAGDVIMSVRAPVGDLNITPVKMCLGRGVCSIRSKNGNQPYLFYLMKHSVKDLISRESGTVFGSVNSKDISSLEVEYIENEDKQRTIASFLGSIDARIETNKQINHNLQQQARAIFQSWFVDYSHWGNTTPNWENGVFSDYVTVKRGGSPRPIQDYLSDTGYRWLKISDVTSLQTPYITTIAEHIKESGISKTVFLKSGSLVLSNSATPGIPKILDVDSCIHDGWLYFPQSDFSNEFLLLFFLHIRPKLVALGNGSVFTNLKTDILKSYPICKPPKEVLEEFDDIIKPLFSAILCNTRQNNYLTCARDALLPKLMSGEIDVSDVEV